MMAAKSGSAMIDKQKFSDLLYTGGYYPRNMEHEFVLPVKASPHFGNDIRGALHNLRRIQIVDRVLLSSKLRIKLKPLNDAFQKDEELAEILYKRGDAISEEANISGSMRYYSLALLAAQPNGKMIGEIYGRRAAVSLTLKDHESCLKDVEMALKHNLEPNTKATMIEFRKKLIKICSDTFDAYAPEYLDKLERKMYRDDVMFRVDGPTNPKIPVAAECIKVDYNKIKGRYLVTTADLAPGTTIIVEKPYVHTLEDSLRWDTQHCGACCKRSSSLIPCNGCMFVRTYEIYVNYYGHYLNVIPILMMYCDEKCRSNGLKNGHRYECPCLAQIHCLRVNWLMHIAFVTVCKAGPVELRAQYIASKKKPPRPISDGLVKGFNPKNGIYEEDSYYQMTKLHAYLEKEELPDLSVCSLILAHVLNMNTNFFHGEPKGPPRNEFIKYVASKLLFHGTSFSVNSFGLVEKVAENNYPSNLEIDSSKMEDGTAINKLSTVVYPFISLLSHSCYPNAVCEHLTDGKMAIIAKRPIKSGEEVSITYGYLHWRHEINYRRAMLKVSHHFHCYCIACCLDWPKLKTLNPSFYFICPNCSGQFHHDEMIKKCLLYPFKDGNGMCRNCKSEVNLSNLEVQEDEYQNKLVAACDLVNAKKPLRAIPIILDCIQFYGKTLCPPSTKILDSTMLLGQAHAMIYNYLD